MGSELTQESINAISFIGGGAANEGTITQTTNKNIYINKLIIVGSPGNYHVGIFPTIIQRAKQLVGLYPKTKELEKAVRVEMLGEKVL